MTETTSSARTFGFQAEVKQLLHLMVHSLYSEREIFLRELISNASDANDKLRFEAIARPELLAEDPELSVRISIDKDAGILTITDNGIGMSEDEVVENLGTIAHSGTGSFVERLTGDQRSDSKLIGQFGVGFYSAFIVADEVTVETRRAGLGAESGVRWISDGRGEFTIETISREPRGTTVRLKIKDDAREFLDEHRIRALVRKYSDHIDFPVQLTEPGSDSPSVLNHAQALWTRSRSDVKDEEYVEFYRHVTHDFAEPLCWSHNRVEGKREYTSLLYIPSVAPFDLWNREAPKGLKLYVKRVFITDHATHFLPLYLRFVRGVVDASDLSLNVSRELLQQDPHVGAIRSALAKRVLDMIGKLAKEEPDKFETFWRQFGDVLKEGLAEDPANKERIAQLLRFHSSASTGDEADRSLEAYVEAAGEQQDKIFYLIADSLAAAKSSPHLEIFRDRGIEVLLLVDRIDEWMMQYLPEFSGRALKDVARGELGLDAAQDESKSTAENEADGAVMQRLKTLLGERVGEVRASSRLKQSAACLVLGEHDLGFQMRQVLKAAGHEAPESVPDLELNLAHPLIRRLARETEDADFDRLGRIVFDQTLIAEGRQLDDPASYMRRLDEFLLKLGLDNDTSITQ